MKRLIFLIIAPLLLSGFAVSAETDLPASRPMPVDQPPVIELPRVEIAPPAMPVVSMEQPRVEFKPEEDGGQRVIPSKPPQRPYVDSAPDNQQGSGGEQDGRFQKPQQPQRPPTSQREEIRGGEEQRGEGENSNSEDDARREQMKKQDDARMMNDFKREAKRMSRDIAAIEKRVKYFEKLGVTIPDNLREAIANAKSLVSQIQNAKTAEELQELSMGDFGDFMQTMSEEAQKLEQLARIPQMLKEANRVFKQAQSALTKAEAKAKNMKVNVNSLLDEWRAEITAVKQAISEAEQAFKSGQADEASSLIEEKVFEQLQTIFEKQRTFDMLANTQRMMKNIDREIKLAQKEISKLKKQKKDVAALEDLFNQAVAKVNELKQVVSQPGVDPEALIDLIESAQDAEQAFFEELAEMTGKQFGPEGPQIKPANEPVKKGVVGIISRMSAQVSGVFDQLVDLLR